MTADVIPLFKGRSVKGKRLPKPRPCKDCEDDIEAARLQVLPNARRCVSCAQLEEIRMNRALSGVLDAHIVILNRW
jgi:hypothetical protein